MNEWMNEILRNYTFIILRHNLIVGSVCLCNGMYLEAPLFPAYNWLYINACMFV